MSGGSVFLDTAYILALLDRRDSFHQRAKELAPGLRSAREVWITEFVLMEVANSLSKVDRGAAVGFLERCYIEQNQTAGNMIVVPAATELFGSGLDLYRSRPDQKWGLTDCISFVVMQTRGITDALTSDHHFRQAGFRALLLD